MAAHGTAQTPARPRFRSRSRLRVDCEHGLAPALRCEPESFRQQRRVRGVAEAHRSGRPAALHASRTHHELERVACCPTSAGERVRQTLLRSSAGIGAGTTHARLRRRTARAHRKRQFLAEYLAQGQFRPVFHAAASWINAFSVRRRYKPYLKGPSARSSKGFSSR